MLAAAGQATVACAVLTACRLDRRSPARPAPTASPIPRPSRPTALLALVAAEHDLLAAYDATLARHPALLPRLAALRADHAAHLDALAAVARVRAGTPLPANTPANLPGVAGAALAALRAAEAAAAARTGAACLAAPATQAALLGSIAACESAHRLLLQ